MHTHSADRALAALSSRQHGVVSRGQLVQLGLERGGIQRRLASRRLHPLYRGVYAVGHRALTTRSRELAAVLACGEEAALSHRSAGRLWGILASAPQIEVTCGRSRAPGRGVVVHRSRLAIQDRTTLDGVPITSLARTLIDLAEVLSEPRLGDAVHEAEVRRLFDLRELEGALRRAPGRRGRHRLRRVLAAWRPRPFTRSEAERRFLQLCARHGLPTPQVNVQVAGYEVDFFWPAAGLVAELDGSAAHHTRRAFHQDRRRDRALAAQGIQVVRVTWRDLEGGEDRLAREVQAILARRAGSV